MFQEDETFYAKNAADADITADGVTFHEIKLPAGVECKEVLIQARTGDPSAYDPWTDCKGIEWSSSSDGPGFLYTPPGVTIGKHAMKGASLGYVRAPSGCKYILRTFF